MKANRQRVACYEDFALSLNSDGAEFRVRLLNSPYGGGEARFIPPLASEKLEGLLADLECMIARGGRRQAIRELGAKEVPPLVIANTLGRKLFESLFTGSVLESYLLSQGSIDARPGTGLRLRLVLDPSQPQLAPLCCLPWELLYRPQTRHYFGRDVRTPICRFLLVQQPSRALLVQGALRVLVAMANPIDAEALDMASERRRIEEAWAGRPEVSVEFLEHAGFEDVYRSLRRGNFEVLHFMGHGVFDGSKGMLLFEDEGGRGVRVAGETLAECLRGLRSLRLVLLNACRTAAFPRQAGQDPYTGVANALVMRGVPAVLAMQFPISDEAATCFCGAFYSALAAGDPVDGAAAEGRLAIYRSAPDSLEWVTPALFLNVPDGRLFSPDGYHAQVYSSTREDEADAVDWAGLQPIFIEDFASSAHKKAGRKSKQGCSLLIGRRGAWSGALVEGSYILINDCKPDGVKYFPLGSPTLQLADAPVSVNVKIESVLQEDDFTGAGLLYRCDPRVHSFYAFLLERAQVWALYRFENQRLILIYTEKSEAIRSGETNKLAMRGIGNSLHLYVNERLVKTIEDHSLRGNQVGIGAIGRGRYRFDNFAIFSYNQDCA